MKSWDRLTEGELKRVTDGRPRPITSTTECIRAIVGSVAWRWKISHTSLALMECLNRKNTISTIKNVASPLHWSQCKKHGRSRCHMGVSQVGEDDWDSNTQTERLLRPPRHHRHSQNMPPYRRDYYWEPYYQGQINWQTYEINRTPEWGYRIEIEEINTAFFIGRFTLWSCDLVLVHHLKHESHSHLISVYSLFVSTYVLSTIPETFVS